MARVIKDLIGERFGRLLVSAYIGQNKYNISLWNCICDCGKEKVVPRKSLISGGTKSCGCLQSDHAKSKFTKHGYSPKLKVMPTYRSWAGMLNRCRNIKHKAYKDYGGRGISVYIMWGAFENFLHDMGECPEGHTLDRINVNGNYEPGNCRWATRKEQSNNRRDNRKLTSNGITLNITQWAEKLNIKPSSIYWRLNNGWPLEKALEV